MDMAHSKQQNILNNSIQHSRRNILNIKQLDLEQAQNAAANTNEDSKQDTSNTYTFNINDLVYIDGINKGIVHKKLGNNLFMVYNESSGGIYPCKGTKLTPI